MSPVKPVFKKRKQTFFKVNKDTYFDQTFNFTIENSKLLQAKPRLKIQDHMKLPKLELTKTIQKPIKKGKNVAHLSPQSPKVKKIIKRN